MWFLKQRIIESMTDFLLWTVCKINRSKDKFLSQRLFEIAELYSCRPGNFDYYNKYEGTCED